MLDGVGVTVETLAAAPLEPGDVITSDGFTGDGTGSRTTDVYSGGTPMPYTGTVTTSGGALTLANNGTFAHFPATLPVAREDVQLEFRLASTPASGSCEFRLRSGTDYVAFEFNSNGQFRSRAGSGATWTIVGGVSAAAGHDYRAVLKGATLTLSDITAGTSTPVTVTHVGPGAVGVMMRNGGSIDNLVVIAA